MIRYERRNAIELDSRLRTVIEELLSVDGVECYYIENSYYGRKVICNVWYKNRRYRLSGKSGILGIEDIEVYRDGIADYEGCRFCREDNVWLYSVRGGEYVLAADGDLSRSMERVIVTLDNFVA